MLKVFKVNNKGQLTFINFHSNPNAFDSSKNETLQQKSLISFSKILLHVPLVKHYS